MARLHAWFCRLIGLFQRRRRDAEMSEEIQQHLDELIARNLTAGMSPYNARNAALRQFGGVEQIKEIAREQRAWMWPEQLWQDLRFGLRMLAKSRGFTIVAVIALALGIGANSAIFSVVNAVLLRPLPYKDPDRLVMVWEDATHQGFPRNTPAVANYIDWREQNHVFEDMAAMAAQSFNLTGVGEPERIDGRRVSASLFHLLGVEPQLGRAFLPEEDKAGGNRVVIISHGLWQRRFGADPSIIGRPVTLNGESYTVVGVMPPTFQFPSREDQLWVPIAFAPKEVIDRGNHYLEVIARLKRGIILQRAQVEMNTIAARLQQQYPEFNARIGAVVVPLQEHVVGNIKPALLVLLGAVGFVLLIACANVANLLLARAAVRQKEIAVRVALGAGRSRLTRQFLTESVLLAGLGGGAGLLLSTAGTKLLKGFIPETISQAQTITVDARVLIFTAAVSLLTGLIFGLAPAAQVSSSNLNETLKEGGREPVSGSRGNRIRGLLVISEVAISFILLIGAGLLINSFVHLRNVDPGFRTDHLLTMKVELPEVKYADRARRSAFYAELIRRIETLPGIKSAAVASNLPLTYNGDSITISIEGRPDPPPDQRPDVVTRVISPRYFATMGIQLQHGRDFSEQDRADSRGVVVISERTARHFWPGENPIGKRLKPGSSGNRRPWLEIVGVVKDVRQMDLAAEPKLQMYLPYEQADFFQPNALVIRTNINPLSLAATVRKTVWDIDKDQPVSNISSMEQVLSASVARQRFSMVLLGIFAALALVLAAVGIYGVMSYSVAQRTHEIGIRMALGAQRTDVMKLTVSQGMRLVVIGVIAGLVAAVMLTRVMSSLLFGISATDPVTFAAISLVLMSAALLASYIPAVRATKVDPMVALRYE
jgi:predicted permease